ncbi:unnamed protein product, partial [Didymodactylos carnosus]
MLGQVRLCGNPVSSIFILSNYGTSLQLSFFSLPGV